STAISRVSSSRADPGQDPGADPGADGGEDGDEPDAEDGQDAADGEDGGDQDTIGGRPKSPLYGQILFNEVLTDGTAEGDPNGDGDTSQPFEDQFVELVNVQGADLALDGFTLIEEDLSDGSPRHTFPAGAVLPAGHALVVFGGGDAPAATATAEFHSANAADPPGLSFGLHLSVPADAVWLLDAAGGVVDRFCYGSPAAGCPLQAAADASLTRAPDLTGDFGPHDAAAGANGAAFSPGTRLDGNPF
ncbi:MAG TPA: lamin tail domain-containing protein, partial [Myxococcota bacterium]|nr:lamin tail domain-containing protein [Myxococcota bacterium]